MSRSTSIKALPIVNVQHDFQNVIADVQDGLGTEDFWVSCYKTGNTSVHGKVRASKEGKEVLLESRQGIEFNRGQRAVQTAACPELSIPPTRLRVPRRVVRSREHANPGRPHQINAFDISPDIRQIAVGFNDGSIQRQVLPANSSDASAPSAVIYRPHVAGVTSLRFFPSSKVLLSAGADFALTVLDADPDADVGNATTNPVRTLKAHSRAVTGIAVVARGRNVLSCAKDGTLRLWDVGGGKQIKVMGSARYSPIMKMSLGTKPTGWTPPQSSPGSQFFDEREVETGDKLVFCALQDGTFEAFDLGAKTAVFHSEKVDSEDVAGALASISYSTSHNLVSTGSIHGVVTVYDTRKLSTSLSTFSRNQSSIEDMAFVMSDSEAAETGTVARLAIATEDGLPYIAGVGGDGPIVDAELIGVDCEGVRVIRVDPTGGIWTAGDDGVVRAY